MVSGQFVDVPTSVSTPLSSGLSKPSSTSILNSSVVSFGTASSSSILNSTSVVKFGISSFSSMAASSTEFLPSVATSTAPTSQLLSSTTSLPESVFSPSPSPLKSLQTGIPSSTDTPFAPNSESTPSSTALKTTETSVQQTSEPGSTITSVTVVPATSSRWDTITTQPTSTLSTPVVLTTTNSLGLQVITTPPLVTLWSTSTGGNGELFTATAVVANSPQADLKSETGILHNTGAVAGIFSVVGVVFTILVVSLVICIRRRRKIYQREKWLAGMQAQRPISFADDPFRDESLPPTMRTLHTDAEDDPWDRKGFLTPEDSSYGHLSFGQTKASIFPVYPFSKDGTFSQPVIQQHTIDVEFPPEFNKARRRPSTPSIYPVSVQDEDKDIVIVPNFNQIATTSNLPPRPPRSHLRDRSIKVLNSSVPTSPEPEHLNHANIVSEPRSRDYAHVLDRKTILDVQSRLITQ